MTEWSNTTCNARIRSWAEQLCVCRSSNRTAAPSSSPHTQPCGLFSSQKPVLKPELLHGQALLVAFLQSRLSTSVLQALEGSNASIWDKEPYEQH